MNERIRELAEQAGFSLLDIRNAFDYNEDNPYLKFAELIVRECIQSIQNESMNSGDEWEDGLDISLYAIRQHFGVE